MNTFNTFPLFFYYNFSPLLGIESHLIWKPVDILWLQLSRPEFMFIHSTDNSLEQKMFKRMFPLTTITDEFKDLDTIFKMSDFQTFQCLITSEC